MFAGESPGIEKKDLFISSEGGYDTYRIPALAVTNKGTILAFCEGRKAGAGDAGDIDLLMRRSTDGGQTWSPQRVVWDHKDNTCGNPCPVVDQHTGTVWLFSTWNLGSDHESAILKGKSKDTRRVFVMHSKDDGKSWSKPEDITESAKAPNWRWYATGPGHGIQLNHGKHKGRLVVPADHSFQPVGGNKYGAHVIYSDDHGKTWQYSDAVLPGANENEVVELMDGRILMNARNHRYRGTRIKAYSSNGGQTWTEVHYSSELQEPRCQASTIRYSPGRYVDSQKDIILFSNPDHSSRRINMTVKMSLNGSENWHFKKTLHKNAAAYSCLAVLPDGRAACFYECGEDYPYKKITFAAFTLKWLTGLEDVIN
ncbi:sialidase family protein [Sedimentisphaera salicampi]|uniref:sialidase family protein n=1 Tax=Sedimentisphaera salicampi TaxID=1941349 RepID=UPI00137481ED|nr:sialidase family protein [Sedimentisphaera salicampi]